MDKLIQLDNDEKILVIAKKHIFLLYIKVAGYILIAIVPIFIYSFITKNFVIDLTLDTQRIFSFLYILWILFLWISIFIFWTNAYLDMWIVTNKRVVNVDQKDLFSREISSIRLENIQDVSVETNGVLATMYKFGDISLETSGEKDNFYLKSAANPDNIKKIISDAIETESNEVKTVKIENPTI